MNNDLDELKRDYRDIEAPPALATRIRAAVADVDKQRPARWLPALTTVAVAVCVIAITPMLMTPPQQQQDSDRATPTRPSLSVLSRVSRNRPAAPTPGLSRVRSVSTPPMPRRPVLNRPGSRSHFDNDVQKETDYA